MGDFRLVIEGVGGHGCDRKAKAGDPLDSCRREGCLDCELSRFVRDLMRRYGDYSLKKAELTHWPADLPGYTEAGEVRDDLLANLGMGRRTKGQFNP